MDEVTLLDRPAVEPQSWFMPDPPSELGTIRGLMLHRLCALSHRVRALAVRNVLREYELDLRDWTVLATLDELGSGTQREVGLASNMDKVAVNRAAARLKDRHLVETRPNENDGRSHHLELSLLGRQTLAECSAALKEFEAVVLARFDKTELDQVSGFLDRLANSLETDD